MAKNLQKYIEVWKLRKTGKTLQEIGNIMGFSAERARTMNNYINFIMRKKNDEYKEIIAMLHKSS